jgi:hypothetical protein
MFSLNKPTLYIHIGSHKTGTSALQAFFRDNRKILAKNGVLYPKTGLAGSAHGLLANSLKKTNRIINRDKLYSDLKTEIKKSKLKTVLISSECYMEGVDPNALKQRLNDDNVRVNVIVYLRRQDSWAQSIYNEIIRDSMRRYTGQIKNMREIRQGKLAYYNVLQPWSEAFGKNNIIVRIYEKKQLNNGLFNDFMSVIGVNAGNDLRYPLGAINGGLNRDTLEFLRCCNLMALNRDQHRALVSELKIISDNLEERKEFSTYNILSPTECIALLSQYEESNEKVAFEYLGRENKKLFLEPFPSAHGWKMYPGLSASMQTQIMNALPLIQQKEIENFCPLARQRNGQIKFLPKPAESEIDRLRAVIMRQRFELANLYNLLDK